MAYCTLDDVQALNPKRKYDTDSSPSVTQVNSLIDTVAIEIDAVLQAQDYTVPVTTPANLVNFLKAINAYGAAGLSEQGMLPETTEAGSTSHGKWLYDIFKRYMKMLADGKIPDTIEPSTGGEDASSYYTDMADKDEFPDPPFRMRREDQDF